MPRQKSASNSHSRSLFPMRRKSDDATDLPLYHKNPSYGKKPISWSWSSGALVHLVPVVLLLCCFILWWFSHPVTLDVKDGVIAVAYRDRVTEQRVANDIIPPQPWMPEMPTAGNETVSVD